MRGAARKLLLTWLWLTAVATPAWAQGRVSIAPQYSPIIQGPSQSQSNRDAVMDADTFVSFIDNALPRTQVRTIFDDGMRVRRPTRAEYFQGKAGSPLPETSLDYQDLRTYGEIAIFPRFSTFVNTGFRWVNPEVNRNEGGFGDMDLGFKFAFLSTSDLLMTLQFITYIPSASASALGTGHVSFEPALLFNYQLLGLVTLEGEGRFWAPVGGSDFAGEVFRYGLGLSYQQPLFGSFWLAPVGEAIGWTVLGGQALAVTPSGSSYLENSSGTTIFDLFGGLRFGMGSQASLYAGYGRSLTGPSWFKDLWRIELRFFF